MFDATPPHEVMEVVGQMHAVRCAADAQLLAAVGSLRASEAWRDDGCRSLADWLVQRLGLLHRTAAELVFVAERLRDLPALAAAFAEGRLSWDQLRFAVVLATPETQAAVAAEAAGRSARELERLAQEARRIEREEADLRHRRRYVRWRSAGDGMTRLTGLLADADAAVVTCALHRHAADAPKDPDTGTFEPYDARCADALRDLASAALADDHDPDLATVVVHTDLSVLLGDDTGFAELEDGTSLAAETARRLACDCRIEVAIDDVRTGATVGIGRATRTVPPWLRRQVRRRDAGCRFPGCDRRRFLHAHHVRFWRHGGPTELGNLASLCPFHHRLVHEGGWTMSGDPDAEVAFRSPHGRVLTTGPPPLRPDVQTRLAPLLDPQLLLAG